ncbi:predicted protein [Micromonas commoda]|uniref:Serine/threonine-protein phosphatase 2A 55 kDa regulatory subunit B n=1 Tax=Micromonas commoda (strain RCC299 / NOUM17 / CCMP2709) TaxID=296587 RepID=C1ED18_MICCC|nr:predicted protein [Micromonas commoda]ACO65678.1 predicted protein [Micromonas commoda]|eukprot:XP_002504420.1 predicted protein [Micromonas commoda]
MAAASEPLGQLDWNFSQVFGERTPGEEVQDADIISAVEFDKTGEHLATGDRGGRVVLFERIHPSKTALVRAPLTHPGGPSIPPVEYRYLTEFQSHEPEFDYLKSLEIEEKINTLRWCHQGANGARFLVSTNDKTIKLWKVFEKQMQHVSDFNLDASTPPPPGAPARPLNGGSPGTLGSPVSSAGGSFSGRLRLPSVHSTDVVFSARCRRLYGNQHAYHINSLSVNSDCETFISADDLRINLWHLESSGSSFNIVDIKPNNMEDLTEVITSAEFHPNQCNLFAYSSSKGAIRLADMRASALCNNHAKIFDEQEPPGTRSFFCEIIASISDVKFSRDGRYILARDYLTVKLWDINMDSKPVAQFKVHEHLRSKLCDLYESDSIFDKFQCCLSDDGSHLATGSYGNTFRTFDTHAGGADTLEVTKTPQRLRTERVRAATGGSLSSSPSLVGGLMGRASGRSSPSPHLQPAGPGSPDFQTKILHMAWHPQEHVLACAASNSLYIFNA